MSAPGPTSQRRGAPSFTEIIAAGTFGGRIVVRFVKALMLLLTGILGVLFVVPLKLLEQSMFIPFYEDRSLKQEPKRLLGTALFLAVVAVGGIALIQRFPDGPWSVLLWLGLALGSILLRAWLDPSYGETHMRIYKAVHDQEWFRGFQDLKGGIWVRRLTTVLFSLLSLAGLVYILVSPSFTWKQVLYISIGYGVFWGVGAFLVSVLVSGLFGLVFAVFNVVRAYFVFGLAIFEDGTSKAIAFLLTFVLCLILGHEAAQFVGAHRSQLEALDFKTHLQPGLMWLGILSGVLFLEGSVFRSANRLWLAILKLGLALGAIYWLHFR